MIENEEHRFNLSSFYVIHNLYFKWMDETAVCIEACQSKFYIELETWRSFILERVFWLVIYCI